MCCWVVSGTACLQIHGVSIHWHFFHRMGLLASLNHHSSLLKGGVLNLADFERVRLMANGSASWRRRGWEIALFPGLAGLAASNIIVYLLKLYYIKLYVHKCILVYLILQKDNNN